MGVPRGFGEVTVVVRVGGRRRRLRRGLLMHSLQEGVDAARLLHLRDGDPDLRNGALRASADIPIFIEVPGKRDGSALRRARDARRVDQGLERGGDRRGGQANRLSLCGQLLHPVLRGEVDTVDILAGARTKGMADVGGAIAAIEELLNLCRVIRRYRGYSSADCKALLGGSTATGGTAARYGCKDDRQRKSFH